MAITIIKKGKIKPEPVYIQKCPFCDTVYTYDMHDVYYDIDFRETIKCPLCKKENDVPWFFKKQYKGESYDK